MRKILMFLMLAFVCSSVWAQNLDDRKYRFGKIILKWSPLHLLDPYPTFQLALEQRLNEKISLQYDVGPVLNIDGPSSRITNKHGFKAKIDVRRYLPSRSTHWRFYFGPEIYYNKVDYTSGKTFFVNPGNNYFTYYKYIEYNHQYREKGLNLKAGAVFIASRFCIDFQVGIAARFIHYNAISLPTDPSYQLYKNNGVFPDSFSPKEETRQVVSPTGCIRFGFIIK